MGDNFNIRMKVVPVMDILTAFRICFVKKTFTAYKLSLILALRL